MFHDPNRDMQKRSIESIWYIGQVIDNNDPEKLQRIKVRSHELHRGIPDEALPWAIKLSNIDQGNTENGVGTVMVPVIGAKVLFKEQDNSQYYPVYMGLPNTKDLKIKELVEEDYPHVYARIDRSGNLFWYNTKKDHIKIEHVSGTSIFIDGNGRLKIEVADNKIGPNATQENQKGADIDIIGNLDATVSGDVLINNQGKTDLISGGQIKIHSQKHIDLKAPRIDLNKGGGPKSPRNARTPRNRKRPEEKTIKNRKRY